MGSPSDGDAEYEEVAAILDIVDVPGYRLLAPIGGGAFGQVFLARRAGPHGFEKLVVLKRLHPHMLDEPRMVEMFRDEARLAAKIHDPRVVEIHELGESDGVPYMAMEYLSGENLATILGATCQTPEKKMPFNLAARVVAEAAGGLHAAHELRDTSGELLNVVHRDVTPSNVFVLYAGGVKLIDFGVAKARTNVSLTEVDGLKGKVGYYAPEQIKMQRLDRRVDIFALGVVLWELLVVRRLFHAEDPFTAMKLALEMDPPPPSSINPEIPKELDAIVLRALARDPDRRYQTAEELQRALEQFLSKLGISSSTLDVAAYMKTTFPNRDQLHTKLIEIGLGQGTGPTRPAGQIEDVLKNLRSSQPAMAAMPTTLLVPTAQRRSRRRIAIAAGAAAAVAAIVAIILATRSSPTTQARVAVVADAAVSADATVRTSVSALERIESAIRTGRFTSPPGENALEQLRAAEQETPDDPKLVELRSLAIDELLTSAKVLWDHDRKDSARKLYTDVLQFDPKQALALERTAVATPTRKAKPATAPTTPAGPVSEERVASLIAEIELAIIERRFVAPKERNALDLLIELRAVDPTNQASKRLGSAVATALHAEAKKADKEQAAELEAAAKKATATTTAPATTAATPPTDAAAPVDPAAQTKLAEQATRDGQAKLDAGEFTAARAAFNRAIAANGRWHPALGGLAEVAFNLGDFTVAVLTAKRAVDIAPRVVAYRMTLAKSYYKLSRYQDAVAQWNKVLEIDPKNAQAKKNADMAQVKLNP